MTETEGESPQEELEEDPTVTMSFGIIAAAGEGRSLAYAALTKAKEGDFTAADDLMAQAKQASLEAHHQQMNMLVQEANGNHIPMSVLVVHAQDHLMTSMLAQELIAEIIELYRTR